MSGHSEKKWQRNWKVAVKAVTLAMEIAQKKSVCPSCYMINIAALIVKMLADKNDVSIEEALSKVGEAVGEIYSVEVLHNGLDVTFNRSDES